MKNFRILLIGIIVVAVAGISFFFINNKKDVEEPPNIVEISEETLPPTEMITREVPSDEKEAKLQAVVELGSEGFNYFIVKIDKEKHWKLEKPNYGTHLPDMETKNTILSGLRDFINEIMNYGVNGNDIHFVVSSGAQLNDNIVSITEGLRELGYVVNSVTPEQEAIYGWLVTVPPKYRKLAFSLDIGSGNSKIAWMGSDDEMVTKKTYGAKYMREGIDSAQVYQEVFQMSESFPSGRTKYCFIIGGVPYKMSKASLEDEKVVTSDNGRLVYLHEPDYFKPLLTGDKNVSGINIYQAVRDGSGCNKFIFDKDANFTIGFLLQL